MVLLSCYILLFLCEMSTLRESGGRRERVLKGDAGEEGDSFSVS